ncbi:hypothetical protein MOC56_21620, partial [Bacillus inaquosorum]
GQEELQTISSTVPKITTRSNHRFKQPVIAKEERSKKQTAD